MHNIILYPVTMNIQSSMQVKSCSHSHLDLPQVPSLWTGCAVVTQHLEQEPSCRRCGKLTICRSFLQGNRGFSTHLFRAVYPGQLNQPWVGTFGSVFPKQCGHTWGSYGNSFRPGVHSSVLIPFLLTLTAQKLLNLPFFDGSLVEMVSPETSPATLSSC